MDLNRSALILKISTNGLEIETRIVPNNSNSSALEYCGRVTVSQKEIEALCEEINGALYDMAQTGQSSARLLSQVRRAGRSLYDIIFDDGIKERLKNGSFNYLILSLDERLMYIPWELLCVAEEFFCLRYAMGIVKGLKQEPFDILRLDVGKMINSLVMASASVYMGLGYHEGIDVMNQLYVRRDSINTSFKMMDVDLKFALENVGKSDIVHFVGNTSYNSNDQNKIGWIFKDGILSADKIRTLGSEKRGPSFVFSDAIQYGKPEEWPLRNSFKPEAFSISDAFLHAGAKHYIGTFWMIPDEARLVFAKEFYTFAVDGRPIGEALRAARLKLIEKFVGFIIIIQ